MDAPLTPDSVRAALEDTAGWDRLDDAGIARLAHHALFFAGRGHAAVDNLLGAFYPEYVKRVAAEHRQQIFARVRSLVYDAVVVGSILPCFFCHDPDAEHRFDGGPRHRVPRTSSRRPAAPGVRTTYCGW